jgi:hypothetical protein
LGQEDQRSVLHAKARISVVPKVSEEWGRVGKDAGKISVADLGEDFTRRHYFGVSGALVGFPEHAFTKSLK